MKDLFVNGCSYATGWHGGLQPVPVITAKDEFTDTRSWVQYFANDNNVQNVWNHSVISKPVEMCLTDTLGFCTQYYEKFGTYKDLFCIIEISDPFYREFEPVQLKGIKDTSEDDNFIIKPFVYRSDRSAISGRVEPFRTVYVRLPKKMDYLGFDNFAQEVSIRDILKSDVRAHNQKRTDLLDRPDSVLANLEASRIAVDHMTDFLMSNDIPYVMFWIGVKHHRYKNLVDRAFRPYMKNHRMVPTKTFNAACYAYERSINPVGFHPDLAGHKSIAEFLSDYVRTYNLTQKPQLELLNV